MGGGAVGTPLLAASGNRFWLTLLAVKQRLPRKSRRLHLLPNLSSVHFELPSCELGDVGAPKQRRLRRRWPSVLMGGALAAAAKGGGGKPAPQIGGWRRLILDLIEVGAGGEGLDLAHDAPPAHHVPALGSARCRSFLPNRPMRNGEEGEGERESRRAEEGKREIEIERRHSRDKPG